MNKKIVFIKWKDAKGVTSEWEYLKDSEMIHSVTCISIGFLMLENEEETIIASHIGDSESTEEQIIGLMAIPCCSILECKEIKI